MFEKVEWAYNTSAVQVREHSHWIKMCVCVCVCVYWFKAIRNKKCRNLFEIGQYRHPHEKPAQNAQVSIRMTTPAVKASLVGFIYRYISLALIGTLCSMFASCDAMKCNAWWWNSLECWHFALRRVFPHGIARRYVDLGLSSVYTTLHCTALHCTALHCTGMHYFVPLTSFQYNKFDCSSIKSLSDVNNFHGKDGVEIIVW